MIRPIVAIVGPTATGKSELALDLAEKFRQEGVSPAIVNADAFQLYREMDIGTAKVLPEERRGIPHHQIDVIDVEQDASVAAYQAAARYEIDQLSTRDVQVIVAGGSGLYLRALLDDMRFPGIDLDIRSQLEQRADTEGTAILFAELEEQDPQAARAIGARNTRRIIRALEVITITGQPFTATLPRAEYVQPAIQIGLDCDRGVLDQRIEHRVNLMWDRGLVNEVTALAPRMGRTASRAVGYQEVLAYLRGDNTMDQARVQIATNTRRLARKQMGWFGRDSRVTWFSAQSPTLAADAWAMLADAMQVGWESHDVPQEDVRRRLGS